MIQTKQDLHTYLEEDRKANLGSKRSVNPLKYIAGLIYKQENILAYRYLKTLRHREYHMNNTGLYHRIMALYYRVRQNRLTFDYGIQIHPNNVGYGLTIRHLSGGVIINCKSMGCLCTVNGGVVVGNKNSQENIATIGNNVRLSVGCKVIGKITLGDGAVVAPNTVVIKDVPAGAVVSGVPAVIIKQN